MMFMSIFNHESENKFQTPFEIRESLFVSYKVQVDSGQWLTGKWCIYKTIDLLNLGRYCEYNLLYNLYLIKIKFDTGWRIFTGRFFDLLSLTEWIKGQVNTGDTVSFYYRSAGQEEVNEAFYRYLDVASWPQAVVLMGHFSHPGICWKDIIAEDTQSRRSL